MGTSSTVCVRHVPNCWGARDELTRMSGGAYRGGSVERARGGVVGPLQGVKIVELAGIGPGPFAGMLLSDMGADIVRIDRAQQVNPASFAKPNLEPLYRGRRSIGVDLKNPEGVELVLRLVEQADALVEGYRPGV